MPERESASPQHDPDTRLGDLFENLPDPTTQIPTVDNSGPTPGSRRAARAAASRPAGSDGSAPPEGPRDDLGDAAAVKSTAQTGATGDGADAGFRSDGAPSEQLAASASEPTAPDPAPPLGGGLDDLFAAQDDHVDPRKPKKRRRGCLIALVIVLAILGGIAAGGLWVWNTYGDRISEAMGWGEPDDWEPGQATGEVLVTIEEGDTGQPVSAALFEAGVTKTEGVFYDYLLEENLSPTFYPGVYKLQEKMTAEAALDALKNEANKLENAVGIGEGATIVSSLPGMAETLGIPLADFEAAVKDPSAYGVDAQSLEGWLFPAVYTFGPDVTATQVVQAMVDRTRESLAAAGVPDADAQRVLTIASIIQREGRTDDFAKVARVIENRLAIDMMLQMDSTAQYGYGTLHEGVVSSSAEALEDPNPWNTYVHTGLPVTPIASSSDAAINAAMNPADGPWLYFVTINLDTGETQFSETYEEHQQGIEKWRDWCRANPEGGC
ncbi:MULTISPECIES: endolytic transglycosylase MltG [unclassified Microbacterium]|uniref:endolytic transglycosylase MltG n=1 Tax=unclassified Microbacterium TaxID=2609290 RepID=UPI000EAA2AF2|nr:MULTISPECIES: endolytic transglycosylase MltG [unclassified Microbacterium]MBT2485989.1 endolytic transglycosylase MltG [Microbacterium sp. ISL-108]RKN68733.1 endolytic transglycosylase MltG [Microbacterium sp. CGR2]